MFLPHDQLCFHLERILDLKNPDGERHTVLLFTDDGPDVAVSVYGDKAIADQVLIPETIALLADCQAQTHTVAIVLDIEMSMVPRDALGNPKPGQTLQEKGKQPALVVIQVDVATGQVNQRVVPYLHQTPDPTQPDKHRIFIALDEEPMPFLDNAFGYTDLFSGLIVHGLGKREDADQPYHGYHSLGRLSDAVKACTAHGLDIEVLGKNEEQQQQIDALIDSREFHSPLRQEA